MYFIPAILYFTPTYFDHSFKKKSYLEADLYVNLCHHIRYEPGSLDLQPRERIIKPTEHQGQAGLAHLAASVLRADVPRHGEARVQDLLSIVQGRLQKVLEVFVLWHVLVARFLPLGYGLRQNKGIKTTVEML